MLKDFYVYAIFRPDGSPCYIGKGRRRRWLEHDKKCRNRRLASIMEKHGGPLPKEKLIENLTNEEAVAVEVTLIKLLGRGRRGPLVNMTDGGEGTPGRVISQATRAKLSAAMTLRMADPDERRKISERHRGKIGFSGAIGRPSESWTAEQRAAVSLRCKGQTLPKEHRIKIAKGVARFYRQRRCK